MTSVSAEERLHEDDSYGNCITCREYIAHTDDETVPVAWPCAVERLRQSIDAATGYRRSHQDDCQCENCRDYDVLINKQPADGMPPQRGTTGVTANETPPVGHSTPVRLIDKASKPEEGA